MELEIHYLPQTDTLYVGTAEIANQGYDIADNLIAHAKQDGQVVGITLEHATQILAPYLSKHISNDGRSATTTALCDDGEPS